MLKEKKKKEVNEGKDKRKKMKGKKKKKKLMEGHLSTILKREEKKNKLGEYMMMI